MNHATAGGSGQNKSHGRIILRALELPRSKSSTLLLVLMIAIVSTLHINFRLTNVSSDTASTRESDHGFEPILSDGKRRLGRHQYQKQDQHPATIVVSLLYNITATTNIERKGTKERFTWNTLDQNDEEQYSFRAITFPWTSSSSSSSSYTTNDDRMIPKKSLARMTTPDYGMIQFHSIANQTDFQRTIQKKDGQHYAAMRKQLFNSMNGELPVYEHYDNDPHLDDPSDCRKQSWATYQFPTCNSLHEVSLNRPKGKSIQPYHFKLVGSGTFRQTFVVDQEEGDSFVVKALLYKSRFDSFLMKQLYIVPFEALIMERLTASPRIVDIHGFCGVTSILEVMPNEVNEAIQPGSGRAEQAELDKLDNVYPKNKLTPKEKVQLALFMAKSLADLHGFQDGTIVHGDNHIDQFLATPDKVPKLGDFNLATIPYWNDKEEKYCKREREPWRFRFRAPEEIGGTPFDENIDVFTMGNNIYSLITGLRPFYHDRRARVVCDEILNGTRGFMDPRYRQRSELESKLIDIMDLCWEHDGDKRIDIFTVVKMLEQLVNTTEPFIVPISDDDDDDDESSE